MLVTYLSVCFLSIVRRSVVLFVLFLLLFRRMFNLCDSMALEDDAARVHFAGDGVVVLPIQENDPACEGGVCNIKGVCKIMTDRSRGCEVSFFFVHCNDPFCGEQERSWGSWC